MAERAKGREKRDRRTPVYGEVHIPLCILDDTEARGIRYH